MYQKVWIIGGSSGIGLSLVRRFLEHNTAVVVSARTAQSSQKLQALSEHFPDSLTVLDMDVSSDESVKAVTQQAWNCFDGIDLCFYNAGVYESMKVSEWDFESFKQMNDVNYLGALRVIMNIVPLFEQQEYGNFACNASISSYIGLPYGGGYSAPKAALLNLCESIQPELKAKAINVQVVNHGFVKTRLTDKNDFRMPQLLEPETAAQKIFDALHKPYRFEIRFPFLLSTFLGVLRMLPYKISLALTKKAL
jgi:short-subunit dehydrogenase